MKLWMILYSLFMSSLCHGTSTYCSPKQPCWPTQAQWDTLNKAVNGHLQQGHSPLSPCIKNTDNSACKEVLNKLKNPFFIESQPGATQSNGWVDAWQSAVSPYVVAAENAQEIAAAVNFARTHRIKLVVKGTGHDYLGRSNAANSLLIWTHNMRQVTLHEHFVPQGCPATQTPKPAVTVAAGTRWIEAYKEVTTNNGRYVQGGGCATVGAAGGFIQGGGFGSFSKKFGTGAAGVLEAEIITADGAIRTANACQNQDLFWALKGGGGGTYGVVSKITLQTHELPNTFGKVKGAITAKSDAAYEQLIHYFINFYRANLNNEHWGEQVSLTPENKMNFSLVFEGLSKTEVDKLWQPFLDWLAKKPEQYQFALHSTTRPARHYWDLDYLLANAPDAIAVNKESPTEFWWASNQAEVSMYINYYLSMYLPFNLFAKENTVQFAKTLFKASRITAIALHFNKGLSGASPDAVTRQKNTAMSSEVLDAAALVIISGGQQDAYAHIAGHKPDFIKAKKAIHQANEAMKLLQALSPHSGTYPNEADYFIKNWQSALWGNNYPRLLQIKHQYDPHNVFTCHHCVGSE
ncbi:MULTISPECIES: FAD-dependent oxidoreductase [Legionella]|uniref:FAD linked oxidase n=1 Tax=Legionella steelei TaxID=947033 RepID=A0A0W0ZK54_9GAMM|nr:MULTISPECIES: FAD-binding protein [Legionella]KTD69346.1 FAD linked oxidase [Legionella steelei]MBN9226566.1 FAD-binding oxidoreductase [Legionella steelei]OJW15512.1 MAG: FAD-binding protein [Legionella sp. 39-23]